MPATKTSPYALRKPCAACPFRTDIDFPLRSGRAREFADQIRGGWEFPCHKTTVEGEPDEEGGSTMESGPGTKACAGALIVQEKEGRINQMMRVAERLGMYDASRLDMDAPVFGSLSEWVRAKSGGVQQVKDPYSEEMLDFEHCDIVSDDCQDPAGFMSDGGVAENDEAPTCNPVEDGCSACGGLMCEGCRATPNDDPDGPLCVNCKEDD